ncbi:o-succinylbenzoate--CoA ligase [Pasteurellaceae bacterium LIM206]|nr:o-succinylbenzoate--CoA ligase [Pasteurellaceae bacterium LIM206]
MFLWQQHAQSDAFKHKIALRDFSQGEVFTWRQLAERIDEVAVRLKAQGINADSAIALCGKNSFALLCHYLAALQSGARVMGINPAFAESKIAELCEVYRIDHCIYFEPQTGGIATVKNSQFRHRTFSPAAPLHSCTLTLTSGSTGLPKAAVHGMAAHIANAEGVCKLMRFTAADSWLLTLPLYHVSGQGIVWRWLLQGAELHLPAADFYRSAAQSSHLSLVPTQLQRFLGYLRQNPLDSLRTRHILLGGSHIPVNLTQTAQHYGVQTYSGYGMTEMGSTVFAKASDDSDGVGQPLKGREYRLVNDEIWLRGAGLAAGYWRDGEIHPLTNAEGWLQTKDKGCWNGNELVILGRLDNMFISGGENIQPEEIECLLQQHESVRQAFVLPKADAEFGWRPVAFIRFSDPDFQSAVLKLRVWLSDKIEKFKQPVGYFPLDEEKWRRQGTIKISRKLLQNELTFLLGKQTNVGN